MRRSLRSLHLAAAMALFGTAAACGDEVAVSHQPARAVLQGRSFDARDPASAGMVLTFNDEFDEVSVSEDGPAKRTRWTDHQWWQKPTGMRDLSVRDGVLDMKVTDASGQWDERCIASVNGYGRGFVQRFGYFEARIKAPSGQGAWGAFWAMSVDHATRNAPASELDIAEFQGNHLDRYWGTLHRDSAGRDRLNAHNHEIETEIDLSQDFHTYGALWRPDSDRITFYVDGKPTIEAAKYDTTDGAPMMVFLNTMTGGWGGNKPDGSIHAMHMLVDYVRVWQFPEMIK